MSDSDLVPQIFLHARSARPAKLPLSTLSGHRPFPCYHLLMQISPLRHALEVFVGLPVSQTNLVGNQLRIWFKFPGIDERAMSLITDVPWRLEHHGVIITTSAEIPWVAEDGESPEDLKERFNAAGAKTEIIVGKIVESVMIEPSTLDLSLRIEGDLLLRSFTVRRDDEIIVVHFYAENRRIALKWDGVSESPIDNSSE